MKLKNEFSAVGPEYAAPTGLGFILVCGATKMPRLRRSNDTVGQWSHVGEHSGGRIKYFIWRFVGMTPLPL